MTREQRRHAWTAFLAAVALDLGVAAAMTVVVWALRL